MSDRAFKSDRDFYGFKTERDRAKYCLRRAETTKSPGASEFWRGKAAEAALNSLENEED